MPSEARRHVLAIVKSMDEYRIKAEVLYAARRTLAKRGLPLVVFCDGPLNHGSRFEHLGGMLQRRTPRGIVNITSMSTDSQDELSELLVELEVPVVQIGLRSPDQAAVWGDSAGGMRPLLEHLLDERGVRRPVLVRGILDHPDSIAREEIFREEMAQRGLEVDEELVLDGEFLPEPTYRAMHELLTERRDMDAVVALNDVSAMSAIIALKDAGLRVPEDVAVTGFDNDTVSVRWPGLTTVDQDFARQGTLAAEMLIGQIDGDRVTRHEAVPSRVIVRGSTAPPGQPAIADLATASRMAEIQQEQLTIQDASLALSNALTNCWTIEQVMDVLTGHLARLGVVRCFLLLHDREHTERWEDDGGARVRTDQAKLVLAYRDGQRMAVPPQRVDSHMLLPPSLEKELEDGMLIVQPLAVLDRPLGYLLFEQVGGSARLTALIRTEVSRAIDAVITTREMREHASMLERAVDRRTRELQTEVATRQRAERELQRANAELQRSAMLDGLTKIANRTAFEQALTENWRSHVYQERSLALLMVDVDAFKPYNDHYGHLMGDEALRTVANLLEESVLGPNDLACRFGGEEFAVVLPNSGLDGAVAVAQRFRDLLVEAAISHEASPVGDHLTVSIGIAVMIPDQHDATADLVAAADKALYEAKENGRDRIAVANTRSPAAERANEQDDAGAAETTPASEADDEVARERTAAAS